FHRRLHLLRRLQPASVFDLYLEPTRGANPAHRWRWEDQRQALLNFAERSCQAARNRVARAVGLAGALLKRVEHYEHQPGRRRVGAAQDGKTSDREDVVN